MNAILSSVPKMPVTLPKTSKEMRQYRLTIAKPRLTQVMEQLHDEVWDDPKVGPKYQAYLYAGFNEDSVEGSLQVDDAFATKLLIDYAAQHLDVYGLVVEAKGYKAMKAMRVVLKKFQLNRKARKEVFMASGLHTAAEPDDLV